MGPVVQIIDNAIQAVKTTRVEATDVAVMAGVYLEGTCKFQNATRGFESEAQHNQANLI